MDRDENMKQQLSIVHSMMMMTEMIVVPPRRSLATSSTYERSVTRTRLPPTNDNFPLSSSYVFDPSRTPTNAFDWTTTTESKTAFRALEGRPALEKRHQRLSCMLPSHSMYQAMKLGICRPTRKENDGMKSE